jgi:hypothetical protein
MFKVKLVPTIVIRGTKGASHFGLAIYIKKYLKVQKKNICNQKERVSKTNKEFDH